MLNMNNELCVVLFPQSACSARPSSCLASSLTVSGTQPCTARPTCLRGPTSSAYRGPCPLCAPPSSTSWTAASCAPKPTMGICVGTSTEAVYSVVDTRMSNTYTKSMGWGWKQNRRLRYRLWTRIPNTFRQRRPPGNRLFQTSITLAHTIIM